MSSSLRGTFDVFDEFARISGLRINAAKSALFVGGRDRQDIHAAASELGIPLDSLPIRYLGIPLTTKMMTKDDYAPLIDKIKARMLSWISKHLSYAGRLQLIVSVISSISNFWCSVFRLPSSCFDEIERLCGAFLWSGNPNTSTGSKIAWTDICRPKEEGGPRGWRLRRSRLHHLQPLIDMILAHSLPHSDNGPDFYLWQHQPGIYKDHFSMQNTWEQLRIHHPRGEEYTKPVCSAENRMKHAITYSSPARIPSRLAFQIMVYTIWRERNSRIYHRGHTSVTQMPRLIDKIIQNRLASLNYATDPRMHDILQVWFSMYDHCTDKRMGMVEQSYSLSCGKN
ncbi:uncharacterized protein LOC112086614 [Eutrema salsugineum]|uniref:uncharacterized protein LOC112086614 n=1 Tax=Eutrema salsugineum TaxID=72664 RepID=UPI000CED6ECD|nr:uncharacterized protein LOC112086614 [Eutrema salsugineum]